METRTESPFTTGRLRHCLRAAGLFGSILFLAFNVRAQNVFLALPSNIYGFTPGGVRINQYAGLASEPTGLAINSAGDLFEADYYSGNIFEYKPGESTFASGLDHPWAVAVDSASNVFVADNSGNIYKYTPTGVRSTFASGSVAMGLAFNSAGVLFAAGGSSINKFTPGGTETNFATVVNDSFGPGLAVDASGDVFAATSVGFIYKFTPGGVRSIVGSGFGDIVTGLACDSAGDLFVSVDASGDTGTITEITPAGAQSVFASELYEPHGLAILTVPEPSLSGLLAVGAAAALVRRRHNSAACA